MSFVPEQLPLNFRLNDVYTLETFVAGQNQVLFNSLKRVFDHAPQPWFIWHPQQEGKTHLLQAVLNHGMQQQKRCVYIPLRETQAYGPAILDGLEAMQAVALDDLDIVAGQPEWEQALFHCLNRLKDHGTLVISSAAQPPAELAVKLPDLQSRLAASAVFQLQTLNDAEKQLLLQQRAMAYGLSLDDDCAQYLLTHYPRSNLALSQAIDLLQHKSLQAQRRLTIPFIKLTLADQFKHDRTMGNHRA